MIKWLAPGQVKSRNQKPKSHYKDKMTGVTTELSNRDIVISRSELKTDVDAMIEAVDYCE